MSSPRRPDDELERLLADDGGELGALYRRLPRAEPPRRLDRNVLAEAARAVHGRRPRRQRWLLGVGSAAGIVLAAGIAWHMGHDALRQQSAALPAKPPAHPQEYVPVQPIDGAQRPASEASPSPDEPVVATPPAAAAPAPAPEPTRRRAAKPAETAKDQRVAAPPPAAPPPLPATAEPRQEQQALSQPVAAPPAPSSTATAAADREPEAAMEPEVAKDASAAAEALGAGNSPKRVHTGVAPSPMGSVELRRDMQLAPEDWLARIRQLMRQGRRQQAIESLRLFRHAHPDWALPDDMRALDD